MPIKKEYYKNSSEGYLILKMFSDNIKGSESYWKNGSSCEASELKGCVPIKEENI